MLVCILLLMIGKAIGMPPVYWALLVAQIVYIGLRAGGEIAKDEE